MMHICNDNGEYARKTKETLRYFDNKIRVDNFSVETFYVGLDGLEPLIPEAHDLSQDSKLLFMIQHKLAGCKSLCPIDMTHSPKNKIFKDGGTFEFALTRKWYGPPLILKFQ